jgi:hypothetical protein
MPAICGKAILPWLPSGRWSCVRSRVASPTLLRPIEDGILRHGSIYFRFLFAIMIPFSEGGRP